MEPVLTGLCHPDPLPGAHRPTAADMHPDPPSRLHTRRPSACPHNTGAWRGPTALTTPDHRPRSPGTVRKGVCHAHWQATGDGGRKSQQLPPGVRLFRVCARVAEVRIRDVNTERRECGLRSGKGSGPSGGWARLPGGGGGGPLAQGEASRAFRCGLLCVRRVAFVPTAVSTVSSRPGVSATG